MSTFGGRRIALLESRMSEEMAAMVRRLGGVPISAPAVREVPSHDDVGVVIDALVMDCFTLVIFLTGAGVNALLREAERRDRRAEAVAALARTTIACRGPKPQAALKRNGLQASVTSMKPHTTRELLEALETTDLRDREVMLVHYGERNVNVADALKARGARVEDVCPYEWALPDDVAPVQAVVRDVIAGRLDAMLFTSQVQCRHLFQIADEMGFAAEMTCSLNRDIVVGSIGPVCTEALRRLSVTPDVIPASPNSASLVAAVADYFELTERSSDRA